MEDARTVISRDFRIPRQVASRVPSEYLRIVAKNARMISILESCEAVRKREEEKNDFYLQMCRD